MKLSSTLVGAVAALCLSCAKEPVSPAPSPIRTVTATSGEVLAVYAHCLLDVTGRTEVGIDGPVGLHLLLHDPGAPPLVTTTTTARPGVLVIPTGTTGVHTLTVLSGTLPADPLAALEMLADATLACPAPDARPIPTPDPCGPCLPTAECTPCPACPGPNCPP